MKRSEFLEWANNEIYGSEKLARKVEEEFGVTWDPEERKLPDSIVATRVVDCDGLHLLPKTPGQPLSDDQVRRIYEKAVAAYNSEMRYMRVVERALAEARRPATSFERILAILEERDPTQEPRQVEPLAASPEMVKAYEELRRFFFGSGI